VIGVHEKLADAFKRLNISFTFYVSKEGAISWTSLNGTQKKKALAELDVISLFPSASRGAAVQAIWRGFYRLYQIYSSPTYTSDGVKYSPAQFGAEAAQWVKALTAPAHGDPDQADYRPGMYADASVTPYMHAVIVHVPQQMAYLQQFQFSLSMFSCHSLEKKNHSQTCDVFRCTLKGGCSSNALLDVCKRELVHFIRYHECDKECK
jgi:hypothetical protein